MSVRELRALCQQMIEDGNGDVPVFTGGCTDNCGQPADTLSIDRDCFDHPIAVVKKGDW